ncbi:MAG: hypothetical protein LUC93_07935 [Planctomycetaceae bacterium]|nr:hypothetical protein [Planctomycetaceae bacterium]
MYPMVLAVVAVWLVVIGRIWAGGGSGSRPRSGSSCSGATTKNPMSTLLIRGPVSICRDTLRIGSVRVASGTVSLGDPLSGERACIHATDAGIVFDSGSTLKVRGGHSEVCFSKKGNALTFRHGAVLDVSEQVLTVNGGNLILDGVINFGLMANNESMLLTFVSVNNGHGVAVIGESLHVDFTETVRTAYVQNPEDAIEEAVLVDAIIKHGQLRDGEMWVQDVYGNPGWFRLSARLGAEVATGGGLRVSYSRF